MRAAASMAFGWVKRAPRGDQPTAYVCERRVCKFPTNDPNAFAQQISEVRRMTGAK